MADYRRAYLPGGTLFFTRVTEKRVSILCETRARPWLRTAVNETRKRWPFQIDAIVLLPDHIHTLWTLPPADTDYSGVGRTVRS